jgi:hypothetical protein
VPENPVHILDYAPRPQLWRRRPFRLTVFAVLLLTIEAAGVYWYPDISFRIRLAYWQRQCMNHVIPPDKIILTADPKLVPTLLQDPDYVRTDDYYVPSPLAAYSPHCWREYHSRGLGGRADGREVQPIIFMHRLVSQRGIERLVIALDRADIYTKVRPEECIAIAVVQPRSLFGPLDTPGDHFAPRSSGIYKDTSGVFANTDTPTIRFHPGQLDPADPSHFTIRWEIACPNPRDRSPTHGIFDFHLSANGDTVTRTDLAGDPPTQ